MSSPHITVIYAHPYPSRSKVCRSLVEQLRTLPNTQIRSLYDRYPDFDIDVGAEQAALEEAGLILWLHPLYWYSVPGLMKHWMDKVLAPGWAYGTGGTALHRKQCLWVASVGGAESTYAEGHSNLRPFSDYMGPIEQTARYCGLHWQTPELVFGAYHLSEIEIERRALALRARVLAWQEATHVA